MEILAKIDTERLRPAVQPEPVKPCTIILVDDDPDDRHFAMEAFKRSEKVKDVLPLPDGEDLIGYLKERGFYDRSVLCFNPILILLDLQMPRLNGFETLAKIKYDPFLKEVPVIVLTTLTDTRKIFEAMSLGADGYLNKPLDFKKLEGFLARGWSWPPQEMW